MYVSSARVRAALRNFSQLFGVDGDGVQAAGRNRQPELENLEERQVLASSLTAALAEQANLLSASSGVAQANASPPPAGWFNKGFKDAGVRQALQAGVASDAALGRDDVINVFKQVWADNKVTAKEFKDLKEMIGSPGKLNISDYVRNLAMKVVNGDPANAAYNGSNCGNLKAGSSGEVLKKLVNKWFYGLDRPNTTTQGQKYAYNYAQGQLFVNGASYSDIRQGYCGDCYFLAALGAVAFRDGGKIQDMFTDNGDGTFGVRFFKNGKADYVTVDRYLPTYSWGGMAFAGNGASVSNPGNELWVSLAEKAYAQLNASKWIGQDGANSYYGIWGGYGGTALSQILGKGASIGVDYGSGINAAGIGNAFQSGAYITLCTNNPPSSQIVGGHAYTLVGYDAGNQSFTVFNPWGINNGSQYPGLVTLSAAEFRQNFIYYDRVSASEMGGEAAAEATTVATAAPEGVWLANQAGQSVAAPTGFAAVSPSPNELGDDSAPIVPSEEAGLQVAQASRPRGQASNLTSGEVDAYWSEYDYSLI